MAAPACQWACGHPIYSPWRLEDLAYSGRLALPPTCLPQRRRACALQRPSQQRTHAALASQGPCEHRLHRLWTGTALYLGAPLLARLSGFPHAMTQPSRKTLKAWERGRPSLLVCILAQPDPVLAGAGPAWQRNPNCTSKRSLPPASVRPIAGGEQRSGGAPACLWACGHLIYSPWRLEGLAQSARPAIAAHLSPQGPPRMRPSCNIRHSRGPTPLRLHRGLVSTIPTGCGLGWPSTWARLCKCGSPGPI